VNFEEGNRNSELKNIRNSELEVLGMTDSQLDSNVRNSEMLLGIQRQTVFTEISNSNLFDST